MTNSNNAEGLFRAYNSAGVGFLAYKMEKLFTRIETDEQRILHNDILTDVLLIIQGDEEGFFRSMAEAVLNKKPDRKTYRRRRFLIGLAEQILIIGFKKT